MTDFSKKHLFRKAALDHQFQKHAGSVNINTPLSFQIVSFGFIGIAILALVWILLGDYTETYIVPGYINTKGGLTRIYPPKAGILFVANLTTGDIVHTGDVLFQIDTSHDGFTKKHTSPTYRLLQTRKLRAERAYNRQQDVVTRLKPLLAKQYIANPMYLKEATLLDALAKEKQIILLDIIHYMEDSQYTIRSPIDGTVASVHFQVGQFMKENQLLVKILPKKNTPVAEIFIPIKHIGFIRRHMPIRLCYDAYPSERFGSYPGKIEKINQTILTTRENDAPLKLQEPYYKAIVDVKNPDVQCYRKRCPLIHGMTLTAVISGDKRKIWQWLLDPLFSFDGTIT